MDERTGSPPPYTVENPPCHQPRQPQPALSAVPSVLSPTDDYHEHEDEPAASQQQESPLSEDEQFRLALELSQREAERYHAAPSMTCQDDGMNDATLALAIRESMLDSQNAVLDAVGPATVTQPANDDEFANMRIDDNSEAYNRLLSESAAANKAHHRAMDIQEREELLRALALSTMTAPVHGLDATNDATVERRRQWRQQHGLEPLDSNKQAKELQIHGGQTNDPFASAYHGRSTRLTMSQNKTKEIATSPKTGLLRSIGNSSSTRQNVPKALPVSRHSSERNDIDADSASADNYPKNQYLDIEPDNTALQKDTKDYRTGNVYVTQKSKSPQNNHRKVYQIDSSGGLERRHIFHTKQDDSGLSLLESRSPTATATSMKINPRPRKFSDDEVDGAADDEEIEEVCDELDGYESDDLHNQSSAQLNKYAHEGRLEELQSDELSPTYPIVSGKKRTSNDSSQHLRSIGASRKVAQRPPFTNRSIPTARRSLGIHADVDNLVQNSSRVEDDQDLHAIVDKRNTFMSTKGSVRHISTDSKWDDHSGNAIVTTSIEMKSDQKPPRRSLVGPMEAPIRDTKKNYPTSKPLDISATADSRPNTKSPEHDISQKIISSVHDAYTSSRLKDLDGGLSPLSGKEDDVASTVTKHKRRSKTKTNIRSEVGDDSHGRNKSSPGYLARVPGSGGWL